jgi:dihydropteroate synthase
MGVVNATPDSFYARSRSLTADEAVARALELAAAGADIVDVGGESTRPGAEPVPVEVEIGRVVPVVAGIRRRSAVAVSVDTMKAAVADAALAAGADMVNDVTALAHDPAMAEVVAAHGAALVLMHTRGTPGDMQARARYDDVVGEVAAELATAVAVAEKAGIAADRVWIDPGLGFAKLAAHSLEILAKLDRLKAILGKKLLVGPSRKSFIGKTLGLDDPEARLEGTLATLAVAVWLGADEVRVQDVPAAVHTVRMVEAVHAAGAQG